MSAVPASDAAGDPDPRQRAAPGRRAARRARRRGARQAAPGRRRTGYRRARAPEWMLQVFAMLAGIAVFIALWEIVARQGGRIPGPAVVWNAAVTIFSDPFYSKGPNDQGIGWNVLSSLQARRHRLRPRRRWSASRSAS